MKKIIIALLTVMILISLSSCKTEYQEERYDINDALKINAYLFEEGTEEPLSWERDDVYELERLKLNKVRIMAPIGLMNMDGLNLFIESKDYIFEVISEDEDIMLSYGNILEPWYQSWYRHDDDTKRSYGFTIRLPNEGYIAASPVGNTTDTTSHWRRETGIKGYVGKEYYLTVNACKLDNIETKVITARLKLVQLKDNDSVADYPEFSRCYSIELISYEYSDIYKIMGDIPEDEED